jgi:hypothetical protein
MALAVKRRRNQVNEELETHLDGKKGLVRVFGVPFEKARKELEVGFARVHPIELAYIDRSESSVILIAET